MIQKPQTMPSVSHDDGSESALVAAVIVKPSVLDMLGDSISGQDFYSERHGRMYDVLRSVHESGRPINDFKIVMPLLRNANIPLEENETLAAVVGGYFGQGMPHNAKFYVSKIISCSLQRKLGAIAKELANRASDHGTDANENIEWLDAKLQGLSQSRQTPVMQADEIAKEIVSDIDMQLKSGGQRGVPTGFPSYDLTYGNLMPGETTILAGGPGGGKTSCAAQIACYNAERKRRVLVVSLEMSGTQIVLRWLCKLGNVNNRDIRSGNVDAGDLRKLAMGAEMIQGIPLSIWSPATATIQQIRAVAKLQAASNGIDLLVIDYVGRIITNDSRLRKHEQIGQFSAAITALAKELSVPVLLLAQLTREGTESEPQLSHLAESSSLERDADTVLFLHRDPKNPQQTKLITAKHRHGETGFLMLGWDPVRQTFHDDQSAPPANDPPRSRHKVERHTEFDAFNDGEGNYR